MSLAYVLLQCDEGTGKEVLNEIKQLDEVKEAHETFGPYDAVIKIESNSSQKIKQVFHEKIQGLHGIRSSLTLLEEFWYSSKIWWGKHLPHVRELDEVNLDVKELKK